MLVTGIYLERAGGPGPNLAEWAKAFALFDGELQRYAVKAGYCMIDHFDGDLRFRKYDGRAPPQEAFNQAETIALAATPPGVAEPGWNWFALCDMSFLDSFPRLSLGFMLDQAFCELGGSGFQTTLRELLALAEWDFGWSMAREKERGIELYLDGEGGGEGLDSEDKRRIDLWYNAWEGDERRTRIRDVFPCNIVGPGHLRYPIGRDRTLRDFIEADPDSELSPLTDKLWLWSVPAGRTEAVRAKLLGTGVIVTE